MATRARCRTPSPSPIDLLPDAIHGGIDPTHYSYGGQAGLEAATARGATFRQFNHEQQASIVADFYARRDTGQDVTAWQPFIDQVTRVEPPGPWWLEAIRNLGPRRPIGW